MKHPDNELRRLVRFSRSQFKYCLWGLIPGGITDEDSPFNEGSHAYLAAAKAVLDHLRQIPEMSEKAAVIVQRLDMELVQRGSSFVTCSYSAQPFNTADPVGPRWSDVPMTGRAFLCLAAYLC